MQCLGTGTWCVVLGKEFSRNVFQKMNEILNGLNGIMSIADASVYMERAKRSTTNSYMTFHSYIF